MLVKIMKMTLIVRYLSETRSHNAQCMKRTTKADDVVFAVAGSSILTGLYRMNWCTSAKSYLKIC